MIPFQSCSARCLFIPVVAHASDHSLWPMSKMSETEVSARFWMVFFAWKLVSIPITFRMWRRLNNMPIVPLHSFVKVWNCADIHLRMLATVEIIESCKIILRRECINPMLRLSPRLLGALPALVVTMFAAAAELVLGLFVVADSSRMAVHSSFTHRFEFSSTDCPSCSSSRYPNSLEPSGSGLVVYSSWSVIVYSMIVR